MGEAQHTPTPWEVWRAPEGGGVTVRAVYHDEMGRRITCWPALCNAGGQSNEANAALIVEAVNSHATLTAALEEARGALEVFAEAHKAYDAYSLCVRVDEFGAPTMRKLQSPTDNDASVVLGSYPISESTSTTVHIRVADFRRARIALATINAALGRKEP